MTLDNEQAAWRKYCDQLRILGLEPYDPKVAEDDPRRAQLEAIVADYEAANGTLLPLPPNWEGPPPDEPFHSLWSLANYLEFEFKSIRMSELGAPESQAVGVTDGLQTIRNAFRVLDWFGVDDCPERPFPTHTLKTIKNQIVELEKWARRKHHTGWRPSELKTDSSPSSRAKRRRRPGEVPDDRPANDRVKEYLAKKPDATIREVAKDTGLATGTISGLAAWKVALAARRASKPLPRRRELPLTDEMLPNIGISDDPAAKATLHEDIWRWLLERASPEERANLHAKSKSEKAQLIELSCEAFEAERTEQDCS